MKKFIFFCLSVCFIQQLQAQPKIRTRLSGLVTDARTGLPLQGASIILSDSRIGTTTDSSGRYLLNNIPGGHSIIEISYAGYRTKVAHLDISKTDEERNFILQPTILENEGVTITAVANATSIRNAPIPITRMNKKDLLSTSAANIIDALGKQPGVSQLSTGPAISKPVIRGLGYNRLVVINDGVRQEGQQWGDEHGIEIDEHSVQRVEIVKGPASLIYGSDAIAGVINIITTSPVPVNTIRGNVLMNYQTNNRLRSFFGNLAGNQNGWNWNIWAGNKAATDYHNRYDGRVYNSRFREMNFGGYAGVNKSWGYSHLVFSRFMQHPGVIEGERDANGNFIKPLPGGGTTVPGEEDHRSTKAGVPSQEVQHTKLTLDNSFRIGRNRLALVLAFQENKRKEFGNVDEPEEAELFFDLNTFNYHAAWHLHDRNGWNPSIGVNGMVQHHVNHAEEALIPDYNLFDAGAFFYTQKTFGSTSFSGGLRYDHRSLNSRAMMEGSEQKFEAFRKNFSNISASAGVSISAAENFVLKLNMASGFRAPSIPELSSNGTHEGTNRYEYGVQDLRSERSLQGDIGGEWNSEHLSVVANLFYNRINHFIFYSKLSGFNGMDSLVLDDGELIPAFRFGQRDAYLYGAELLVDFHPHPLDWLHWENRFSLVRGKFVRAIENVKDLPLMPAPRWVSEFRADFLKQGKKLRALSFYLELDHNFSQEHPFTAYNTETATASYTLFNAGVSTDIVNKKRTLFSIYLNALNLGDVAYQGHLSRLKYTAENPVTGRQGVFNMGRNFSIKLNIPF